MHETTVGKQLAGFLLLGGIGAAIAIEMGKKEGPLDFGQLVLQSFTRRVAQEIPEWPAMNITEQPVDESYAPTGPTLALRTGDSTLSDTMGFIGSTTLAMARADGEKIWRQRFGYYSRKYDRMRSLDEFKADDNKLLKEEMRFAADLTAEAFIDDLRASK